MAIKVIIRRNVPAEAREDVYPLFIKLRELAVKQDGYISGETLRNFDDPNDYIVISTWRSLDDWKAWEMNPERNALQNNIDMLIGIKTEYRVYHYA